MQPIYSSYELQEYVALEIARLYSIEYSEPFFVVVGSYSNFDIVSSSKKITIELKCETSPLRTGNVCIEFWNTSLDKPSGILGTKATIWVHIVLEKEGLIAYEYDIHTLRKVVIEQGVIRSNGRNSLCKIISLEVFRKFAKRSFQFQSRFKNDIENQGRVELNV
ncbi:MAG: hypothetical protein HZB59_10695 [Ignavibacteriales bacterium]|nr:hypothetical protein [Ignavibacteriales bacterium]